MKIREECLKVHINELELPVRYANMLRNANIETLDDLAKVDFTKYRNVHTRMLNTIQEAVIPYSE